MKQYKSQNRSQKILILHYITMNLFTKGTIIFTSIKRRHSFFTKYIRSSKISANNSFAPLHPFHLAPCINFRYYPVVIQHMKRKRLQQHGVWTLHLKTIFRAVSFHNLFFTAEKFLFFDFSSTV
jgi:hypothetical protein